MTRAWSALVGLLIAAPFYWLLVDTLYEPDLIAGGVAVVIAAAAYSAACLESDRSAAIKLGWLTIVLLESAKVPRGIVVVCREILSQAIAPRARRGVIEVGPFDAGEGTALDLGRRALAEACHSLAPDTVVIGVDSDSDRLLIHRIGGER